MRDIKVKLFEEKVFKDPIHQYIYVQEKIIWDLINAKEFQRLRRIRQLGTSFLTFHGAEHSRFSHSLGVYEITRKVIAQFERNEYDEWPKEERLVALIAALLHDIGHAPFSHSMERVFQSHHEDWTKSIILGDTEINQLLTDFDRQLPMRIVDVINKTYEKHIVVDLISSQLDADRMDYLLRDAYFTGVNYGTFDLERILRVIRPYNGKIVIKDSGMHAVEDYLMSRYQMYWQIYFHPVTRSGEIILRKIFLRAKELYQEGYSFSFLFSPIEKLMQQDIGVADYISLDEPLVYAQFHLWSKENDSILVDLTKRFLHRKLFKYIEIDSADFHKIDLIKQFFSRHQVDPEYYLEIDSPSNLPYDTYGNNVESENSPIYLLNRQNDVEEISTKSDIISGIMGKRKTEYKLFFAMDYLKEKNIYNEFCEIVNCNRGESN